mgnify:FL=1
MSRIDLHLHSRASTDTGSWFLEKAFLPESFTDPADAYATAKKRGMDFVALTDHNTIAGAHEIAHLDDVIVGVEVTVAFPEDGVPLHVLVWGVDDATWADLDALRGNVYEMVDYLLAASLPHALAHPLHRVGGQLTSAHLERCLLLFGMWEGRNGARPAEGNEAAMRIGRAASPQLIERLAEKHDVAPRTIGPPAFTGGSDDHGLFDVGTTWTETPHAAGGAEMLTHLRARRVEPHGAHGSAEKLAHSVGTLAVKGWIENGRHALPGQMAGIVSDLIKHPVERVPRGAGAQTPPAFGREIVKRLRSDRSWRRGFRRLGRASEGCERDHARLRAASDWLAGELLDIAVADGALDGGWARRAEALVGAFGVVAPYVGSAGYLRREAAFALQAEAEIFGAPSPPAAPRAVMLTDTFDELNGVAGTMRRLADDAARRDDPPITVLATGDPRGSRPGLRRLEPATRLPLPIYGDAGWTLGVPNPLDLLRAIEETGATIVHAATPGPMGLLGLAIARSLGLRFVATYHTELSRYALELTGDRLAAAVTEQAVGWFYDQAERIYVPTRATGVGLMERGVDPHRLFVFGRGIDTDLFHPERHSRSMRRRLGPRGATVVLYVGRLSREKGLDVLAEAMRAAGAERPDLSLALVGEGPFRADLAHMLRGVPHRFLGPLRGEELAAAYASSDIFCLPSETETYGQVVAEAGASGLPPVVTDGGAASEHVVDGVSGLVARAGDAADLALCLARLASDPPLRGGLAMGAWEVARRRGSWSTVFDDLIAGYGSDAESYRAASSRRMSKETS